MIKVIDNVISKSYQEYIRNTIFDMNWAYKPTLSAGTPVGERENFVDVPGFSTVFYNRNGVVNPLLYNVSMPMAHICCSKIGFEINNIYYGRSFFQQAIVNGGGLSNPHVDIANFDHLVCLYYVFDADGDTAFFDQKSISEERPSFEKYTIIERVTPKQGRVVLFDGRQYHANFLPETGIRAVININLGGNYDQICKGEQ